MTRSESRPDGVAEAERFLGEPVEVLAPLTGGEDARVFKVRSGGRDRVLRVSYEQREDPELEWVSRWVEHVASSVPQAVPRERRAGRSFFRTAGGGVATVLPFVEGVRPRRRDPAVLVQAAALLAGIHRAGLRWTRSSSDLLPRGPRAVPTPSAFADSELDAAWARALEGGLRTGPVHGDFYGGNLLARDGAVVAVLDWDDARVQPLLLETAGAIFEFARDREHRLDPESARRFLREYRDAGGPLNDEELVSLGLAMRVWVRRDARVSLAYDPAGGDYLELQARAFRELPDQASWAEGVP